MSKIIYPEKIKEGDTVAITAVSMPANKEKIDIAIKEIEKLGLKVIETPNVRTDGIVSSSGQERANELLELYKNPDLDHKPEQLAKRGGAHYSDAACETIASIYGNKLSHIVVTTKNNGSVPDLPADCAVEVSSYIGSTGARAIAFGPLQPAQRGWLQCMKNMELYVNLDKDTPSTDKDNTMPAVEKRVIKLDTNIPEDEDFGL